MKDPHIIALIYDIETTPLYDYDKARPVQTERGELEIEIADGQVRIGFREVHYATAAEASQAVGDLLTSWEIIAGLTLGPGSFVLKFAAHPVMTP